MVVHEAFSSTMSNPRVKLAEGDFKSKEIQSSVEFALHLDAFLQVLPMIFSWLRCQYLTPCFMGADEDKGST